MDESQQVQPIETQPQPAAALASPAALPNCGAEAAHLLRFLYTHNPFYVISALLVFSGLWQSFSQDPDLVEAGAIALGLAAYALLLALTAWLIIRLGRVWDDVRSLLLLVVLMFLAISISCDPVLNAEGQPGSQFMIGGLLFAITLSEALLRSLPLRLPAMIRIPYYLALALFFLYPLAMSPLLRHQPGPALYWALFGFSAVAGVIFLTLLPAIRRGPGYVRDNGSPWKWPLYPWVLFGMLGLCVCMRAYSLCVSFHAILGTESIFGLYFLVPFQLAVNVLLLEAGIVSLSDRVRRVALVMPIGLVGLCVMDHRVDAVYMDFLQRFIEMLHGTPLFVTLWAALLLYAYAAVRRVPRATTGLLASLAALSFVGPGTLELDEIRFCSAWPIMSAGGLLLAAGIAQRDSRRSTIGAAGLLAGWWLEPHPEWLATYRGIIALARGNVGGADRRRTVSRHVRSYSAVCGSRVVGMHGAGGGDRRAGLISQCPSARRATLPGAAHRRSGGVRHGYWWPTLPVGSKCCGARLVGGLWT